MTDGLPRDWAEPGRYVISGLVATAVHFGVLSFNLNVLHLPSAAIATFVAAIFGLAVSFAGSRWFVFRGHTDPVLTQLWRFCLLYAAVACLHAAVLYLWTDRLGLDYRIGFVIATALQMVLTYFGNKLLVFG